MLFMTLANKVTSSRFLLCILYYVLLSLAIRRPARDMELLTIIFVLNQVIAWTDLLDGYLARKYKEVTHFGRIADPLVDKILVVTVMSGVTYVLSARKFLGSERI